MQKFRDFISQKLTIRIPLWAILLLPFVFYLVWEGYWFTQVGLRVVKWHVHVVEYVYVWLAGVLFFAIMSKGNFSEKRKNLLLAFTSICFALGLMETTLQLTGTVKTYMEKVGGDYSSPYQPQERTWYHVWNPSHPHWITKPEYSYWRPTNSLGFGDYEWTAAKKPKQKRITALGDSFTEGDGAPYDSSYVYLLNKKLQAAGDSVYMMNAGVCGSDPFNNYVILRDKLLRYQTDVVLQVLATNDMTTDILLRGGTERFQKDGTQKFRGGPWWEPLYAVSYISRFFFHLAGYNELLQKGSPTPHHQQIMNKGVADLFKDYSALCRKNHIRLILLLRPDLAEIEQRKYSYDFSPVLNPLKKDTTIQVIDLLPSYIHYIEKNKTMPANYFWKIDGHHNPAGYEMMAQTIFENISPLLNDSIAP